LPKVAKELSAREVSRITKPGSHPVGGVPGLILRVSASGARSWVLRIAMGTRVNQKGVEVPRRRDIGLGGYPGVTLAQAREKARDKRELIEQGIDPVEQREANRRALQAAYDNRITFKQAAEQCHTVRSAEFKNAKHAAQWLTTVETYAYPYIGNLPVDAIETHHIEKMLLPIWQGKTETARRVRQRVETIIRWAYTKKKINRQNPARWDENLKELLPNPEKIQKRSHFAALSPKDMPDFMVRLQKKGGMVLICI
jgi:integrase-like protein/Arm domain-containing DNA-binding protein